ncbi:hypothetical protein KO506_07380 [Polaribacter vadi]|uniref:hypothetical protein n=1 Tax=Polaribacter TaxID=52959 RepID=UPI001C080C8D|nr:MULTISPECIES: hypothetical protein [Polaribacter]MBU3011220.1 hypothetical protein [Polaribacter vadi]
MKKNLFLIYFFLTVGIFLQSNLTGVVYYESGISQQNIDNSLFKIKKITKK